MTESGFRPTGTPDLAVAKSHNDFAMLEPREQLATLLKEHVVGRPFSELAAVTFDHRAATVMGHVLIDALEDAGYSIDDFDAVGALTAASVPMVSAMIQAAASRGEDLDGFVMDFVYPSIKGPSIEGRRVVLLDAWLSEKSYVQTSSLVTLRNGNELSLDFGIVEQLGAKVVAIASLVGAAAIHAHDVAVDGDNKHLHELLAEIDACDARIKELQAARVIALDIIPGAVPMEAYAFPKRCLLLFGAEGPGLSEKALALADDVVYISQFGSVRSINAGAAAAVAMHAWIAQHAVSGV